MYYYYLGLYLHHLLLSLLGEIWVNEFMISDLFSPFVERETYPYIKQVCRVVDIIDLGY